jgi:hypothetical protein
VEFSSGRLLYEGGGDSKGKKSEGRVPMPAIGEQATIICRGRKRRNHHLNGGYRRRWGQGIKGQDRRLHGGIVIYYTASRAERLKRKKTDLNPKL